MLIVNGKPISLNGKFFEYKIEEPLPPYTLRLKYKQGTTPIFSKGTGVLFDEENNIWDLTYNNTDWSNLLQSHTDLLEVINANTEDVVNMEAMFSYCGSLESVSFFNTSNVTNMQSMFTSCASLTTVPLFDTSNVTNMFYMFNGCSSLTYVPLFNTSNVFFMEGIFYYCYSLEAVPLFDTSSVTNMARMFYNCTNVQSGALALYQQASTQATPPTEHTNTFYNCGINTETGSAELAQIPASWGGTGV